MTPRVLALLLILSTLPASAVRANADLVTKPADAGVGALLPAYAQADAEAYRLFDEGNRLFREGRYRAALDRYQDVLDTGHANGPLYYNMGNACYRLDELGQAILFYEKARTWMPERTELAHNLEIARQQRVDAFSQVPDPFWRPAWERLVQVLSPTGIFVLGLLGYLIAAAALAMRIHRTRSPWLRRIAWAGGMFAITFLTLGWTASFEPTVRVRAVVLHEEARLMDHPSGSASEPITSELTIHEGTVLDVLTIQGMWSEVRLPNGVRGWIPTDAYETI